MNRSAEMLGGLFERVSERSAATHVAYPHGGTARFALPVSAGFGDRAVRFLTTRRGRAALAVHQVVGWYKQTSLPWLAAAPRLREVAAFAGFDANSATVSAGTPGVHGRKSAKAFWALILSATWSTRWGTSSSTICLTGSERTGGQELVPIPVAADPEKGRAYLALPNEGNVRWLVLAEPALRRAGLTLFRPSGPLGKAAKWLMVAGLLWGDRVRLDEAVLSELEERFASLLGAPETRLAIYTGTSGAYRKATIQIMSPRGDVLGYAKAADRPLARSAIEAERDILLGLSSSTALRDYIPRVLGWMEWRDYGLLVTSSGPPAPGPKRLGEAHMAFLDRLWHVDPQYHRFRDSPLRARWQKTLDRYDGRFPDAWRQRYRAALPRLDAALGGVEMPFSFAHRDFAPWNTCQRREALFVFDWEGAVDDAPPLYDAFHFQAIQAALRGKRLRLDIDFLRRLGVRVWRPSEECLESLFLAYLMDISLYYAEARVRAPEVGEESVWHWFGNQIDRSLDDANRVA